MSGQEIQFGIKITADGKGASAEVRQTAGSMDALAASTASASAQAEKLNAVHKFQSKWFNETAKSVRDHNAAVAETSGDVNKLLDRYDPLSAKLRQLQNDFKALDSAARNGKIAARDDARVDMAYAKIQQELSAAGTAATEKGMFATVQARRELMVLGHEAMTGNFSRMPGSFMVLAERTNLSMASMMGLGGAGLVAAAAIGGVAFAAHQSAEEMHAMDRALASTSNFAGQTRGEMRGLAMDISAASQLTIGQSKDVVTELAASGRIGAAAFGAVAGLVDSYARATGQSAAEATPKIIKMFEDPTRGAEQLNQTMHFLTVEQMNHIRVLQESGKETEAQLVLADALKGKISLQTEHIGTLSSAWNSLRKSASGAWDSMMGVGRADTTNEKLAKLRGEVDRLSVTAPGSKEYLKAQVDLQKALAAQEKASAYATQQGINAAKIDEANKANKLILQYSVEAQKEELRQKIAVMQAHPEIDNQAGALAAAKKQLAELGGTNNSALNSAIAARKKAEADAAYKIQDSAIKSEIALLDQSYKAKLLQEGDYYARRAALESTGSQLALKKIQDEIKAEVNAYNQSAKPEEKERHLAAYIKLTGDLAAAWQHAADVGRNGYYRVMQEIMTADEKYLADQYKLQAASIDWIEALNDQNALRDREVALLNDSSLAKSQNSAAQRILNEQNKIDLELKKRNKDLKDPLQIDANIAAAERAKQSIAVYETAKYQAEQYQNASKVIEQSVTDALMRGFERGKDFGKNAADSLKNMFKTLVLRPIIQPIAQGAAGAFLGLVGMPGVANAAGGNLIGNAGSSLLGSAGSFLGIGSATGAVGSGGAGLYGSFATSSLGETLGLSAFDAGAGASFLSGSGAALGAALPWVGGAIALAGALGLFSGDGDTNRTGNWASSKTDIGLGNGSRFGYTGSTDNHWFSGAEMGAGYAQFSATLKSIDDTLASSLHLTDKQIGNIQDRLVTLNGKSYDFGMEHTDWLKSAAPGEIMKDRYGAVFDEINAGLGDLVRTAQGDANAIAATVNGLVSLTQTFEAIGTPISALTKDLIDAAGGIAALQQSTSFYYQNFYTDAERLSAAQTTLAAQFKALGQDIPATRDEFRKLMEAQDLSTESGREAAAELFKLAPALVSVSDAAAQSAKTAFDTQLQVVNNMQGWIDQVTGFVKGIDKAIFDTQLAQSSDPAAMLKSREADLWQRLNGYQVNGPFKAEDLQHQVDLAGQIKDSILQRYQIETAAVQKLTGFAQNLSDYAHNLKIGDLSPLATIDKIAEAQAAYDRIVATLKPGSTATETDKERARSQYNSAGDALLTLEQGYYGSSQPYTDAYNRVLADTQMLGADTLTEAERQTAQLSTLAGKAGDTVAELQRLKSVAQGGLDYLNGLIAPEIHKLGTIADSLGSSGAIATALNALPAALAAAVAGNMSAATRPNAGTTPVMGVGGVSVGGTVQGRDGLRDAVVLGMANAGDINAAMSQAAAYGYSTADMAAAWNAAHPDQSTTAPALAQYGKDNHLQGFATGGTASSGYYIAHEGELIEGMAATRIFPAEQTSHILDRISGPSANQDALIAEVRRLREENQITADELKRVSAILLAILDDTRTGNEGNETGLYQIGRKLAAIEEKVA